MGASFFFVCRACEYYDTPTPGKTKNICVQHIIFRDRRRRVVAASGRAFFVTLVFADQKNGRKLGNGRKLDARTQRRTGDPLLCPVKRWAVIIARLHRTLPDVSGHTPVCAMTGGMKTLFISSTFVRLLMRSMCSLHPSRRSGRIRIRPDGHRDGHREQVATLGCRDGPIPSEPFAGQDHDLGRWVSGTFLVYIRPQVLEWTNTMSVDMIHLESFLDVAFDMVSAEDPRTRTILRKSFNGRDSVIMMPKFHLHH
jgi:hypothetical protein